MEVESMDAAKSRNEITSTIHRGLRGLSDISPTKSLTELIASLDEESQGILKEILDSNGEKAMIVIARGAQKGARFLINQGGVSIGRSSESSIFLDDVTVSRSHARITRDENSNFHLIDNSSLNGTYLNNETVEDSELTNGDEIQIGKFHLIFIGGKQK